MTDQTLAPGSGLIRALGPTFAAFGQSRYVKRRQPVTEILDAARRQHPDKELHVNQASYDQLTAAKADLTNVTINRHIPSNEVWAKTEDGH